jgi:hypothetical protein
MRTSHHGQKTIPAGVVVKLLGTNERRISLLIVNNSSNTIYKGSRPDDTITNMTPIYKYANYANDFSQDEVYLTSADESDVRFEEISE